MKLAVVLVASAQMFNGPPPVWQLYPHLVCEFQEATFCDFSLTKCNASRASAVLVFDFSSKTIQSLGMKKILPIEGTNVSDLPREGMGLSSVYSDGSIYSFVKLTKGREPYEADTVDGFAQSPSVDSALTAHMVCHP